ncbi:MAG: transglycosylase SLT domain-containing protein [Betaproteobacteria bacterium]
MTQQGIRRSFVYPALAAAVALAPLPAQAGAQIEEQLAPSVAAGLQREISDAPIAADYVNRADLQPWLVEMSRRLAPRMPDERERRELLATIHYEARRAGLDPQLVLGVMHHESGFKKFAVSPVGARGFMQVMPFWVKQIGSPDQNLFNLRINLRYGCVILRHYLAIESGDLYRALGRYNGSLGRPEYPSAVVAAISRHWHWDQLPATNVGTAAGPIAAPISAR